MKRKKQGYPVVSKYWLYLRATILISSNTWSEFDDNQKYKYSLQKCSRSDHEKDIAELYISMLFKQINNAVWGNK